MILSIDKEQFHISNICFGEKNKNNIIDNSNFYGITYTNELFTVHHLYIHFQLRNIYVEKYFNKYKIVLKDENSNAAVLDGLADIEDDILTLFDVGMVYNTKLHEQIFNNNLKFVSNNNLDRKSFSTANFLLKISGIWENGREIGLIYKIILE